MTRVRHRSRWSRSIAVQPSNARPVSRYLLGRYGAHDGRGSLAEALAARAAETIAGRETRGETHAEQRNEEHRKVRLQPFAPVIQAVSGQSC